MCLIFLSLRQHPHYKLIVATNRDEFYARQTVAADWWSDYPQIVGGKDGEAAKSDGTCGTWMAMNKNGRIAMVTNYRDIKNSNPQAPSRGFLVTDFVLADGSPKKYLETLEEKAARYNGFNLIAGNADELFYLSNYKAGIEKIETGFHALSNHLLDTPWPKVKKGEEKLKSLFSEDKIDSAKILDALHDDEIFADELLPDTGVGLERERMLSPLFIKSATYGTRCSTLITIDRNNTVEFTERVYTSTTFEFADKSFVFTI